MKAEINEGRYGGEQMRRQKVRFTKGSIDEGLTDARRKVGRQRENSGGIDGGFEAGVEDRMDR